MPGPKIVIIGAGPAGLTLCRLLQKNNIPCTIYEADADRHARNQGGTLDLHAKAGQRALKEAGLFEEFQKHSRPEGDADKIVKPDGTVLWDENELDIQKPTDDENDKPEIDRAVLRNLLLDSIEPSRIQWGRKVQRIEADPRAKGHYTIHFADGSKDSDIELLVGADGAWSKVRPLLTDVKPYYSGITGVELWSLNVSETNPWLSKYVGAGSMFMFDEGRAIIAQRQGNDSIRVYACVRQPETWQHDCGIDWTNHEAAREAVIKDYFNDCNDDLKRVISTCKDELIIRPMNMLPVGVTWPSCPGVTLLGDAAHLMTPFAGVGVNTAMADALVLGRAIIAKKDGLFAKAFSDSYNIQAAIKEYEKFMFDFGKEQAEKTAHGLKMHFSASGGEERANKFKKQYKQLTGKDYEQR